MVNNKKQIPVVRKLGSEFSHTSVPFSVYAAERRSMEYVVNIFGPLENLVDIEEALCVLNLASEEDNVTFNLNSPGGSASVLSTLLLAMEQCACSIHVQGSGDICSAATFILLNADSFILAPDTHLLFHAPIWGGYGEMADNKRYTDFVYEQSKKLLHTHYQYFFTEEEINRLIDEKYQHWMAVPEFLERFNKRNELLAAEQDTCDCEECTCCDDDDEPLTEEEEEELYKALEGLKHRIKDKEHGKPLP